MRDAPRQYPKDHHNIKNDNPLDQMVALSHSMPLGSYGA